MEIKEFTDEGIYVRTFRNITDARTNGDFMVRHLKELSNNPDRVVTAYNYQLCTTGNEHKIENKSFGFILKDGIANIINSYIENSMKPKFIKNNMNTKLLDNSKLSVEKIHKLYYECVDKDGNIVTF